MQSLKCIHFNKPSLIITTTLAVAFFVVTVDSVEPATLTEDQDSQRSSKGSTMSKSQPTDPSLCCDLVGQDILIAWYSGIDKQCSRLELSKPEFGI